MINPLTETNPIWPSINKLIIFHEISKLFIQNSKFLKL